MRWVFAVTFLLCASAHGDSIDTFAGTGKSGYAGDNGPARAAKLDQPFHCDLDTSGNLYIAEAFNHCVRKVNLKTGIITTVAGCGRKGYTGDGGPATKAAFNEIYAVTVDANGDLYLVDRLNAAIRKVDAGTQIVTTVAGTGTPGFKGDGGKGTEAQLHEPNDCCLDGKGGLLIADVADWRIRRLDLKTGVITTFAGTGRSAIRDRGKIGDGGPAAKAILVGPRAVCVDGKGTTYVCEREGNAIRRIDANGFITTLAGTGKRGYDREHVEFARASFDGPKGLRCDAAGNVYVVDTENHAIRKIDLRSKRISTVAGGQKGDSGDGSEATKAGLDRPHGCILDAAGTLYIADSNNHRIRRVVPTR
jgi:hypothetical protein